MREKTYKLENGKICEYGKPISNERIVELLNKADFLRSDLSDARSRINNLEHQSFHFRQRCLRFENGLKDCVSGHENLRKFAKRMGVI